MRPKWLRPPLRDFCSVSALRGWLPCVRSEKSGETRPRLPGVVGLCVLKPMMDLLDPFEELDVLAGGDGHDRLLPVRPLAGKAPHPLLLAAHHLSLIHISEPT